MLVWLNEQFRMPIGHAEFLVKLVGEREGDGAVVAVVAILPLAAGVLDRVQAGEQIRHRELADRRFFALFQREP